jgi:hypothetical protein
MPGCRNVQLICLTDLEQDYLNPFELSARVNKWVVRVAALAAAAPGGSHPRYRASTPASTQLAHGAARPVQVAEVAAQAVLTLFLVLSKHYALAALHIAFDLYLGHLVMDNKMHVDATDAFKQLPAQKRQRTIQLAVHVVSFMIVVYK